MYRFFSSFDLETFLNTDRHRNLLDRFMPNSDGYTWVPTGPIEVKLERARIYRNAWQHSIKYPDYSQTHQVRLYDAPTDSYIISDEVNQQVTTFFDNAFANNPVPQPVEGGADNFGGLMSPLDQFAIHPLIDLNIGNYFFSFTNLSLSMLLTLVFDPSARARAQHPPPPPHRRRLRRPQDN